MADVFPQSPRRITPCAEALTLSLRHARRKCARFYVTLALILSFTAIAFVNLGNIVKIILQHINV